MLIGWWLWAYSSQVPWSLRIDNVNPCDTVLLPHHQPIKRIVHELITYPVTPLPYLAFKNTCPNPLGILEFGRQELPISLHGPTINLALLQTLTFPYCLASLYIRHMNLLSVTILARQPRVCAHSRSTPATESPFSESPEAAGAHLLQGPGRHCPWEVPTASWHKTVWSK